MCVKVWVCVLISTHHFTNVKIHITAWSGSHDMCDCCIVDKFMATFPASFVLFCSVIVLDWDLDAVDMRYHNFINEIFLWFRIEIHEWLSAKQWAYTQRTIFLQSSNIVQRSHFMFQVHIFLSLPLTRSLSFHSSNEHFLLIPSFFPFIVAI